MTILRGNINGYLQQIVAATSNLSLRLYFVVIFQFLVFDLDAQIYPVQVTPILIPPYSLYIDDYYRGEAERLAVILLNTDLQKPILNVRLRMYIEGSNIKLYTKDGGYFPALSLEAGIPRRISLLDLAPYFKPEHLNFYGISSTSYSQKNKLPEGHYAFCFEVLDISTGQVLSKKSCTAAWISLSDPPLLNIPLNGESIASGEIQNIIFQWTPRNLGNPNNAFNTEYEFTLKELLDWGMSPQAAFQNSPPLYRVTTKSTSLLMGPSEPQLIPGKRYAWQIKNINTSLTGEEIDVYRNNGYSEIFWFTYQNDCKPPLVINAEIKGSTVNISWATDLHIGYPNNGYAVQYREYNQHQSNWYTVHNVYGRITLYDLKPGTVYEYRIGSRCNSNLDTRADQYIYSTILRLETNSDSDSTAIKSCGMISPEINIANLNPIQDLIPGDLILAGGFPVKITKVTGSQSFSGEGYVTIPILGKTNVRIRFAKIKVNTDKQLFEGTIETIYDQAESQMVNLDKMIEGGYGIGRVQTGKDYADFHVNFPIGEAIDTSIRSNLKQNGIDETLLLTLKGKDGESTFEAKKLPTTVKDSKGVIYNIDTKDGEPVINKVSEPVSLHMTLDELNKLNADKGNVIFKPHPRQQFAFDEYQPEYAHSKVFGIDIYEKLNENYFVSAKAIVPGKTDLVIAQVDLKDDDLKMDSIEFITAKGIKMVKHRLDNTSFEISVIGGPANDAQELFAVYPKSDGKYLSLGKLLIASYQPKTIKVTLVPVNGAALDALVIDRQLNATYNPIGITVEVSQADHFTSTDWDLNHDGKLGVTGSGWLATQTAEMKALNNAFKLATPNLSDDRAVLFVLDGSDSTANLKGDMPRGKQFGYLFNGGDGNIAAHEIGHGIFQLEHTFNKYGFTKDDLKGNVMNYPPGNNFTKFQWDAIHSPGIVIGIFENDEDSMYETDGHYSTVYLVSLMLGMSNEKAKELATATEAPDTKIHSPMDYELNQTWAYPTVQQNVHALTGGFHGVEEFITALKILYTPKEKIKEIGELLHRFGDTYAHTKLDNLKPNELVEYKLESKDPAVVKLAIENWKGQGSQTLAGKVEPWISYFNHYIKKYGLKFLADEDLQKQHLNNKTLPQTLGDIYLIDPKDKFQMYGGKFATHEHSFLDSTYPDLIYMRPEWYLSYVKNLTWVLASKYNLNESALDFNIFKKMVDYSIKYKCSLKGIIDYEIAKKTNKKEVFVPVFYSKIGMLAASVESLFFTDYYTIAKEAAKQTREYILRDGWKDVRIDSEAGKKTKYGKGTGFFDTLAFKIIYK